MGGFLALKFSKHGYDFNQNPIKLGGKLKKSRKFNFNSVRKVIVVIDLTGLDHMSVAQCQAIIRPRKSYCSAKVYIISGWVSEIWAAHPRP